MRKSNFKAKTKPGHQAKQQNARKKKPAPYQMRDKYFLMAKKDGYRARSAYKLKEIQEKFGIIEEGMNICDIGAAPGSFIQYMKRIIRDTGAIVGIDLKPMAKYSQKNIITLEHDIFEFESLRKKIEIFWSESGLSQVTAQKQFDLITSDIAPNTTGRKDVDQYASVELNIAILKFADEFLKPGGNLLLKVFKGEDFGDLTREIQSRYEKFTEYKPFACRDRSFEEYIICLKKK